MANEGTEDDRDKGTLGEEGKAHPLGVRGVETEAGLNDVREDWHHKGIQEGVCMVH